VCSVGLSIYRYIYLLCAHLYLAMHDKMLLRLLVLVAATAAAAEERATYIVHMAKSAMPREYADHGAWYGASLRSVSGGGKGAKMLYAYDTVLHGFSARLTAAEARALACAEGVLAVNPETRYELHTTRTPEFLGIAGDAQGLFPQSGTAGNVVVGVLDTGVWPESKSYDDAGLGAVPSWWKGECEAGTGFNASSCNRKLLGARFFSNGYEAAMGPMDTDRESRSPRDDVGHGTHTSSTAAGAAVPDASLFGFAAGTARGMAPRARVAAYKVCWLGGCFSSDILAGLDAAVADGCGALSLSLGGGAADYSRDSVAIGAFAAMERGVHVSCSAGNSGPGSSTLSNVAPWITTVGAGTLDRDFPAYVALGNGKNYTGVSLYAGKQAANAPLPIVYAGNASNSTAGSLCMAGTLVPEKVKGKIVVCDRGVSARVQKGLVVRDAGGAGMVLSNTAGNGQELVADAHLLPAAGLGDREGAAIKAYVASDPRPTATIVVAGTHVHVHPSPVVAAFSSRGPNMLTPEILKPDFVAPGVNILAAWTGKAGPTGLAADTRRVGFNIISGTSMSCPHVSGLAALLRSAHPGWSPAAVRSALMTTAYSTYGNEGSALMTTVRLRRGARGPQAGGGPRARLRPRHPRLRRLPLRAQVQRHHDRRGHAQQGLRVPREQDPLRRRPQLPVLLRGLLHGVRCFGGHRHAHAHAHQRGRAGHVQGVHVRGREGRDRRRAARRAGVHVGGREEELHGDLHIQDAAVRHHRVRPPRLVRRQAHRGQPDCLYVDLMDTV
jgi:subtilisin family serine protease